MALSLSSPRVAASARLRIQREDLRFGPLPDGRVLLEVNVHNDGDARSASALARVSFAPFGAFVPGKQVGTLQVPPIPARGRTTLRQTFADLDWRDPSSGGVSGMLASVIQPGARVSFAGNFDVFVRPSVAAERHRATIVRCTPGATNMAMFVVGSEKNSYRFSLAPDSSPWPVELTLGGATSVEWGQWSRQQGSSRYWLFFQPPEAGGTGALAVVVSQRSPLREASVEFSLSTEAEAPSCMEIG